MDGELVHTLVQLSWDELQLLNFPKYQANCQPNMMVEWTYGGYHGNILEIYMDADTSSYRDFECIWVSFFLFYSKSVRVK